MKEKKMKGEERKKDHGQIEGLFLSAMAPWVGSMRKI